MLRILVLGGTAEGRQLAEKLCVATEFEATYSLAGRLVRHGESCATGGNAMGTVRIGGFGGVPGLRHWVLDNEIAAIVDATHPFAARMSSHAAQVSRELDIPLLRLRRPAWIARPDDCWLRVPDLPGAATLLSDLGERIFLSIGRQGVAAFADNRHQWFLIRSIQPPDPPLPPRHEIIVERGPFECSAELDLLRKHRIDVLVTKDSGTPATAAKLTAARLRQIPVVMVDRPAEPDHGTAFTSLDAVCRELRRLREQFG